MPRKIITTLALFSSLSLACGPTYDPLTDMQSILRFEPDFEQADETELLLNEFIYSNKNRQNDISNSNWLTDFLNIENVANGRELNLITESAYKSKLKNSCYNIKFSTLSWDLKGGDFRAPSRNYSGYYKDYLIEKNVKLKDVISVCLHELSEEEKKVNFKLWAKSESILLEREKVCINHLKTYASLAWGSINHLEYNKAEKYLDKIDKTELTERELKIYSELKSIVEQRGTDQLKIKYSIVKDLPRTPTWGRCYSNHNSNILDFASVISSDLKVSDSRYIELLNDRINLQKSCIDGELEIFKKSKNWVAGDDYDIYLAAATDFYLENYNEAIEKFSRIKDENNKNLYDIALYAIGRSYLLMADKSIDNIDFDLNTKDENLINSEKYLTKYIELIKNGKYRKSAIGLLRRIHLLMGEKEVYNKELYTYLSEFGKSLLANPEWLNDEILELENAISEQQRFLPEDVNTKRFFVFENILNNLKIPEFESEKYSSLKRIKNFIYLNSLYYDNNFEEIENNLESLDKLNSPEFSLYIRALENQKKYKKVINIWKNLPSNIKEYLVTNSEYEIARIEYTQFGLEYLLKDEDIKNIEIKTNYLAAQCDEKLQFQLIRDKSTPIEIKRLLVDDISKRYIYSERFLELDSFLKDLADEEIEPYALIRTAVRNISTEKDLGTAYMNVAYFMQNKMSPNIYLPSALQIESDSSCRNTTVQEFGRSPYYFFNKSLKFFGSGKEESEAKALHYLVLCAKPGQVGGSCKWGAGSGDGLDSKSAYNKLHTKYPNSKWTKETPYYY